MAREDSRPSPSPASANRTNNLAPTAVGSRKLLKDLGITPRQLWGLHPDDSTEDVLANFVVRSARALDHLHERLVDEARHSADNLTRLANGTSVINSLGVLQNSATQIDILAARHADAVEHLDEAIHMYRQVARPAEAASPRPPQLGTEPSQAPAASTRTTRPERGR
ncbi:hypothetical protein ACIO3O_08315 [Streptomyces sp. NPDC087440]|uniref:hypothetical protein n=1 Tax=Streptomyces sp. NPDC087440 TaxID=3365790 RepID=UPI0038017B64